MGQKYIICQSGCLKKVIHYKFSCTLSSFAKWLERQPSDWRVAGPIWSRAQEAQSPALIYSIIFIVTCMFQNLFNWTTMKDSNPEWIWLYSAFFLVFIQSWSNFCEGSSFYNLRGPFKEYKIMSNTFGRAHANCMALKVELY